MCECVYLASRYITHILEQYGIRRTTSVDSEHGRQAAVTLLISIVPAADAVVMMMMYGLEFVLRMFTLSSFVISVGVKRSILARCHGLQPSVL